MRGNIKVFVLLFKKMLLLFQKLHRTISESEFTQFLYKDPYGTIVLIVLELIFNRMWELPSARFLRFSQESWLFDKSSRRIWTTESTRIRGDPIDSTLILSQIWIYIWVYFLKFLKCAFFSILRLLRCV